MSEQNKIDHNQPGGIRGTHLDDKHEGITNRPKEEAERQKKVVEQPEGTTASGSGKGA